MTARVHSEPFAQIPEWVLDADISDRAIRLFCVLHRHSNTELRAYPGRKALSQRLHCSVDSIDRALAELVDVKAITVKAEHRPDNSQTVNSYYLWPCTGAAPPPQDCGPPAAQPRPPRREGAAPLEEQESEPEEREPENTPPAPVADAPTADVLELRLEQPPPPRRPSARADFDAFWNAYRKKVNRLAAEKAWKKAVKRADPQLIVDQARAYAATVTAERRQFQPYPASWLNAGGWENEVEETSEARLIRRAQQRRATAAAGGRR